MLVLAAVLLCAMKSVILTALDVAQHWRNRKAAQDRAKAA
jgi:hypothetical protein